MLHVLKLMRTVIMTNISFSKIKTAVVKLAFDSTFVENHRKCEMALLIYLNQIKCVGHFNL